MVRAADINAAFFAAAAAAAAAAASSPALSLSDDSESASAATSPRDSESGGGGDEGCCCSSQCTSPASSASWPATPEPATATAAADLSVAASAQRRLRVLEQARRLKEYRCLLPESRYVDVPAWQRVARRTRPGAASLRRTSDAGTSSQCSTPHARRVRFCGVVSEMLYCVEAGC